MLFNNRKIGEVQELNPNLPMYHGFIKTRNFQGLESGDTVDSSLVTNSLDEARENARSLAESHGGKPEVYRVASIPEKHLFSLLVKGPHRGKF